jgi:hypothetical protein
MSDIRDATVAMAGRHVCLTVSFAKQPFGRRQRRFGLQLGLSLSYRTQTAPYLQTATFAVETNYGTEDGLAYAGLVSGGVSPRPANAHVELRGNTLRAAFDLDSSFPLLRPAELNRLTWRIGVLSTDVPSRPEGEAPLDAFDQLPNVRDKSSTSLPGEIRQSNGRTVEPR